MLMTPRLLRRLPIRALLSIGALAAIAACTSSTSTPTPGPIAGGDGDGGSTAQLGDGGSSNSGTSSSGEVAENGIRLSVSSPTLSNVVLTSFSGTPTSVIAAIGKRYIVVTAQIENVSNARNVETATNYYTLKTAQGLVYRPALGSDGMKGSCAGGGEVSKGAKSRPCKIAFEYPDDETPSELVYTRDASDETPATATLPTPVEAPPAYCDTARVPTAPVTEACLSCLSTNACEEFDMTIEDGVCTSPSYCSCLNDFYSKRNEGLYFRALVACIDTHCAAECVPNNP